VQVISDIQTSLEDEHWMATQQQSDDVEVVHHNNAPTYTVSIFTEK
jgi:hypothetical protein